MASSSAARQQAREGPLSDPQPRVLSIQSHTVHGYVGNKCAVLPLQLLGYDVDPINSVQFSNHTGYPSWRGSVLEGGQLWELIEGLAANDLLQYTHLLTGYIKSESLLRTIVRVVELLRKHNPNLIYVCDPVLGDNGRLYVGEGMVTAFREAVMPVASIITPNQFEAEQLTGMKIAGEADALEACRRLHAAGPHTVVITSMDSARSRDELVLMASTTQAQANGAPSQLKLVVPRLHAYFTGTGDMLAALLLAWLDRHPGHMALGVEKAVAGLQCVLQATAAACGDAAMNADRTPQVNRARELRLVQNQHCITDPTVTLRAEPLNERR